jgi:hypothetical protein
VAAAAVSMIQLRVSFLEEDRKGDKGKANKTVTQSILQQNAAAMGLFGPAHSGKGRVRKILVPIFHLYIFLYLFFFAKVSFLYLLYLIFAKKV